MARVLDKILDYYLSGERVLKMMQYWSLVNLLMVYYYKDPQMAISDRKTVIWTVIRP